MPLLSLLEELLVEEEDEEVHIDFGLTEHLHHSHALILQLQQVLTHTHTHTLNSYHLVYVARFDVVRPRSYLVFEQELLHLHAEESSFYFETSSLRPGSNLKHDVLKPGNKEIVSTRPHRVSYVCRLCVLRSLRDWQVFDLQQNALLVQPGGTVAQSRKLVPPFAVCRLLIGRFAARTSQSVMDLTDRPIASLTAS